MTQEWYYNQGGQRRGPVSMAELKQMVASGSLKSADPVWKEGMAKWVTARSIKGLFPETAVAGIPAPPTAPKPVRPPGPPPLEATEDAGDGGSGSNHPAAKIKGAWQRLSTPIKVGILGGGGLAVLLFFGCCGGVLLFVVPRLGGGTSSDVEGTEPDTVSGGDKGGKGGTTNVGGGRGGITKASYDRIHNGMSLQEVEAILGPGEEQAAAGSGLFGNTATVYKWQEGFHVISVSFLNGRVQSKAQAGL